MAQNILFTSRSYDILWRKMSYDCMRCTLLETQKGKLYPIQLN